MMQIDEVKHSADAVNRALDDQLNIISFLRSKEDEISEQKKKISDELEKAESRMKELLEACGRTAHKTDFGHIYISERTSVKMPSAPEDRELFFNYLKAVGSYDSLITVNANKLSSMYIQGLKEAAANGATDFEIPGIKDIMINPILSFKPTKA